MDPDAVDALYPGTLTHMFEGILANPDFQKYEISVLSRPTLAPGDTEETADYFVGGPWVIMLDNALSSEEADRLIELGGIEGYERSADVGHQKADGTFTAETNSGRTSTNAWCQHDCYKDPTARAVMDRVANITSIPEVNSEYLQMLQYEKSQFYQTHSDYIPYQVNRPTGVRILTFYFYLSDVEEGGGTNFPKLGLTVTPKKGRAVLWPSVLDDEPNQKDARSDHQALPVIKGVKYGANAWIHQRDYKTWSQKGC
jgi:prolyl 4-hydroxylase